MRRFGFIQIVFWMFFMSIFVDVISVFFSVLGGGIGMILPILVMVFGIVLVVNAVKSKSGSSKTTTVNYRGAKASSNVASNKIKNISNADLARIDKTLVSYYKSNVTLPIIDNIALTTSKGIYTTIEELYLTYKDEKVVKLAEFKNKYPEVYNKIVSLLVEMAKKGDKVMKEKVDTNKTKKGAVLSDAEKYIDQINELNKNLNNEEITNGLYQTCDLLKQIDIVNKEEGKDEKLTKLYDYYLPILTGILEDYKKLSNSAVKGEDFKKCETQLVKTVVLINQALKTICASLHESDYMNLNADITTLQSLLAKDGYGSTPFDKEDK